MNKIRQQDGKTIFELSGDISLEDERYFYDYFQMDYTAPSQLREALSLADGKPVVIRVDSPGGSLIAGAAMYTDLMEYPGPVEFTIGSFAASAATVVAMASAKEGNACRMSPLALLVIHNVQGGAQGDYREMEAEAQRLRTANQTILAAYRKKTGLPEEELRRMLDAETWFSAEDALAAGLVDEILFEGDTPSAEERKAITNALIQQAKYLRNAIPFPQNVKILRKEGEAVQRAQAALDLETIRL